MPVIYQKKVFREDLKKNPAILYLFGDNEKRVGLGGQAAEMRGEQNAVGVRTKRAPTWKDEDFWSDQTFHQNCAKIEDDLTRAKQHLRRGGIVVVPIDGIGTNRADMEKRCPRTFNMLQQALIGLANIQVTP